MEKIFKNDERIKVYQKSDNTDVVIKKYDVFGWNREDYIYLREKLMAIKHKKDWPNFVIKPIEVGRVNKTSFVVKYPYVQGIPLYKYINKKNTDLLSCARLIRKIEEKVLSSEDLVFQDLANTGNIILSSEKDSDFSIIDIDDIQFDKYTSDALPPLIAPMFQDINETRGMRKCMNGKYFNKQLDMRSIYALFYALMNGPEYFYPVLCERTNLSEYKNLLNALNIPKGSSLYRKTMNTLKDNVPNEPIGEDLFDLALSGYEFETYGKNKAGYRHRLVRNKKYY